MAGSDWRSPPDIKLALLAEGHRFSFYQVMRLLPFFHPPAPEEHGLSQGEDVTRIRPKLSLAFPAADVDRIEEIEDRFRVTTTFLGLYGSSSPLPTFYTEDLMDEEAQDESVTREFLDIFNHRFFQLLFRCWTKHRTFLQVVEEHNDMELQRMFSMIGLGEKPLRRGIPDAQRLLRYIGLFTQFPRSALGLQTLLRDALETPRVVVASCIHRKAKIPEDQRLAVGVSGCSLGVDSYVGEEIDDRMGKFRIQIGPLMQAPFQNLLPEGKPFTRLTFLTRFFMTDPLEYDVELILAEKEAQCVCLGQPSWSRLGLDTWIFSGETIGEVSVMLCPKEP